MACTVGTEVKSEELTPAGLASCLGPPPCEEPRGEELIFSIFEHAAVGMEQVALDGRLLMVNGAFCRMLGYSKSELLGKTSEQITYPEDRAQEAALLESMLLGECESYEIEKRYLDRNGLPIWAKSTSSLVMDATGKPMYRVLTVQDITARKRAEEVQSASERAFVALADFVPQFVWMCTPDGMNIYFNQRWVDYTGLTLEESYGRGWNIPFHPDEKQAASDAWNHAVETGEQYCIESRLRAADGSYRWFLMRGEPMRSAPGALARWFGTCTDIEDLKRESEGRFRSVLDNSRDVVYRINLQTDRYEYISPSAAAVVGYSPDELMALNLEASLAMVHPDDLAAMRASLARSKDSGRGELEYRQRTRDGGYRWLSNRTSLINDNAGHPLYRDGSIRDITERKKTEAALRESEEEFRVLAQNLVSAVALINAHGEFSIVNRSFLHMFDLEEDSNLLNVNSRDWSQWRVFDENGRLLEVDEHPVRQAMLTRTAVRDKLVAMQSPERTNSKWLLISAEPILDGHGNVQQVVCTYRDITERKQAEEALREEKATLQGILDATGESIWLISADSTILSANATALKRVGRAAGEVFGKTVYETSGQKLGESRSACVRQVVETARPLEMEDERDGMVIRHHYYPVLDTNGCIDRVVVFSRDITESKKAEETLHRYRLLARHARDIVLFMRCDDGLILEANAAAAEAYGYTIEQLKCLTIHDLRETHTRPLAPSEMAQADMQGILFESIHQRSDGSVFPVEVSSQGANIGGTRTLISIIRDIAQRKQAEEALRSSQEQIQAIIDGATETVVFLKDVDGRFITVNSRFEKLLGITRDEVRGKTDYDILTRDRAETYRAHDQLILTTGQSMQVEEVALLADGKEHTFLANKFPLVDASGRPYAVCAISADITERKQAEEALRQSEERFRALVTTVSSVVYRMSPDWREMRHLVGKDFIPDTEAASGTWVERYIPGDDQPLVWAAINEAIRTKSLFQLEHRVLRVDGSVGWTFSRAVPQQDANGEILEWFGTANDITDRKQAEEELRNSERRYSALFANKTNGMAHCRTIADEHGKPVNYIILQINEAYERIVGVKKADIEGRLVTDVFPDIKKYELDYIEMYGKIALDGGEIKFEELFEATGQCLSIYAYSPIPGEFIAIFTDVSDRKQAEEALRQSEEKFRLISTNSPDILSIQDRDLRYELIVNPPLGWVQAETIGKTDRELLDPEQFEKINALKQTVMNTGEAMMLELPLKNERGEVRYYDGAYIPRRDAPGTVTGILGYFRDITERKQAEEALHESEERVRVAVEAAELGTWNLDLGNDIAVRSLRHDRIWGYTEAQPKWSLEIAMQNVVPDDRQSIMEAYHRGIKTGLLSHENRINWPDGSIHWISAHGRFQYDDNGRPIRVVGVVSDITDRKRAEEALQNSQQRMTAIIDSAMDAVITVGADQRILVFNAAAERIFGCPAEEAIGYSLDRFIPTIFREAHRRHVEGFAGSGTTSRSMHSPGILSGLRANGEEFPLEATISRVTVSGEKLCTVILRDLTQRIQAEQALLRSEKLASVGRMAATIAHEINNPLAAVTNLLYVAKTVDNLPESARQFLEMADAELNRVAHITRQSLGFYREFSVPAPTSVTGVLESAIDLLKNKIKAKQAVIEKQWAKNVEITAIAGELRQVFANLLGNSLDAIGEKGMITLRVSACTASKDSHRCVRVTIADSGNGIDRTAQQHVFEPFFTTKGAVGTGLGLWVSKQIVEKHGGTIRLRSSTDEKHRGTVFSIILPVEPVECGQSAGAT